MNPINQALSLGYSLPQVINFLSNAFPQLSPKIQKAQKLGYSTDKIINFLANTMETDVDTRLSQSEMRKKRQEQQSENAKSIAKAVGLLGAGAAAMPLLRSAGTAIQGLLSANQSIPQISQDIKSTPSPQIQTPGQAIGEKIHTPGDTPNVPNLPQQPQQPPQQITQHDIDTNPKYQPEFDYLARKNLLPKLQTMAKAGKSRVQMVEFLKKNMPMMEQEYLRTLGPGGRDADLDTKLGSIVDRFIMPKERANELPSAEISKEIQPNIIATKSGDIGEVKGADSSGLLLDINGKVKKYKEEDLIESPLPEKDLADLYQDVIGGIEKETGEEVSRNVFWAGFDPKTNELIYIPHGGGAYIYDEILPEDVKKLTELLTQRKSTGENYIGAWTEGSKSPIGAAMHQLIMKLQKERGGKGQEYKNKFENIYDALGPAKEALKRKYAKRKKKA